MTLKFKVVAVALAISTVGVAHAQKAPQPDYTFDINVGAVSQYRFRGLEQTAGNPALQAGVDFAHKNGFYAGAWTSSVTWVRVVNGATAGEREIDYFLGFKTSVANIKVDIGAIQYQFPGNNSGVLGTPGNPSGTTTYTDANTTEVYLGLSTGIVSFKVNHATSNFMGNKSSNGARYYDLSLNIDLGNGLTFVPHVGFQTVPNVTVGSDTNAGNYTDYALTLNKNFGKGWSASVAAVGTNASTYYTAIYNGQTNRYQGGNAGVVGVKYTF